MSRHHPPRPPHSPVSQLYQQVRAYVQASHFTLLDQASLKPSSLSSSSIGTKPTTSVASIAAPAAAPFTDVQPFVHLFEFDDHQALTMDGNESVTCMNQHCASKTSLKLKYMSFCSRFVVSHVMAALLSTLR